MESSTLARWMIYLGIGIVLLGILIWVGGKFGIKLGNLPGDVSYSGEKFGIYFPIMTSIIASILLTIFINLLFWIFKK